MNFLQLIFLIPAGILVLVAVIKTYLKYSVNFCDSKARLDGKVAIVTGATSGIGYETAKNLAKRGAKVIIPCRNLVEGNLIAEKLKHEAKTKNIKVKHLELSLLSSVREFCREILVEETRLDILVNNAGIALTEQRRTTEGFETHYVTNYLGPFLLTNILIELMIKTNEPGRIVNVSSIGHKWVKEVDFKNLNSEKSYESRLIYAKTKLYNVLFSTHLHQLLTTAKLKLITNSVHPGAVQTRIFRDAKKILLWKIVIGIASSFFRTPWEGAQTLIHVAVSENVQDGGLYWDNCMSVPASSLSQDLEVAKALWDKSMKQAKIQKTEYHLGKF